MVFFFKRSESILWDSSFHQNFLSSLKTDSQINSQKAKVIMLPNGYQELSLKFGRYLWHIQLQIQYWNLHRSEVSGMDSCHSTKDLEKIFKLTISKHPLA